MIFPGGYTLSRNGGEGAAQRPVPPSSGFPCNHIFYLEKLAMFSIRLPAFLMALAVAAGPLVAQDKHKMTKADVERQVEELSNWGRWGKDDQLGALNLITPEKRKEALALVKEGVSVSPARDVEKEKAADNGSPFFHVMDRTGTNNTGFSSADTYKVSY